MPRLRVSLRLLLLIVLFSLSSMMQANARVPAPESDPVARQDCPDSASVSGQFVNVYNADDFDTQTWNMWFKQTPVELAGWEFFVEVANTGAEEATFKIKVVDSFLSGGWNFGYSTLFDKEVDVTIPVGVIMPQGNFWADPNQPNSETTLKLELWWNRPLQGDCLLDTASVPVYSDDTPPFSQVVLPENGSLVETEPFAVHWYSEDYQPPASGVRFVVVEYNQNSGNWTPLGAFPANQTSVDFVGSFGNDYCFRSRAVDRMGHEEANPTTNTSGGDICVTVAVPDISTPVPDMSTPVPDISTPTPPPVTPGDSGTTGGLIAFRSSRDGNQEIYIMNADGSGQRNLTNHSADDESPDWSPDGTRIVFASDRDGNREIYVMGADGSNLRNLTNHPGDDFRPVWSPDGSQIAFVSVRDGDTSMGQVYVMNTDGSNVRRVSDPTIPPLGGMYIAWTPDGQHIAFEEFHTVIDKATIYYLVHVDTGTTLPYSEDTYKIKWSPDGSRVVFRQSSEGKHDIYVMDVDGSNWRNLTNHQGRNNDPAWSPDGRQIVFSSDRDEEFNQEIYVMNADGSNVRRLTNSDDYDSEPAWQPSGASTPSSPADSGEVWFTVTVLLNVRSGPEITYEVIGQVSANDMLRAVGISPDGKWVAVNFEGTTGWATITFLAISSGNLADLPVIQPSASTTEVWATAADKTVHIFAEPDSMNSSVVVFAHRGDEMQVIGVDPYGGWYLVDFQGTQGWVEAWAATIIRGSLENVPVVELPPAASLIIFSDDFSTDKGWTNETGGHFFRDTGQETLAWYVDRSAEEMYYIPISPYSGNVHIEARVLASEWANNCNLYFGLAEDLGGWPSSGEWPNGLFIDVGWFGAGVGSRITTRISFANGSAAVGWDAEDSATYVNTDTGRWYQVVLETDAGTYNLAVYDDAGNFVGRWVGTLPGAHGAFNYVVLFNRRDGDWPTGSGLLDDLVITRKTQGG